MSQHYCHCAEEAQLDIEIEREREEEMTLTDRTLFIPTAQLQKKTSELSFVRMLYLSKMTDIIIICMYILLLQNCYFFKHIKLFSFFFACFEEICDFTFKIMRDILNSQCHDPTANKYRSSFSPKSKNKTNCEKVQIKK